MDLKEIEMSFDETHHLYHGNPLYARKFERVMSFHPPGLAAVRDHSGAYHIDVWGNPVYTARFLKSFGYYEGLAAVCDSRGWFHIDLDGRAIYTERYQWTGNFQEGRCAVRTPEGEYFHIDRCGSPAYPGRYRYVGDFKYGIAVVYTGNTRASHIDKNGNLIHGQWYRECDVYHKGFATARDERGYLHIGKDGAPAYDERYMWVEPFYNEWALCRTKDGELVTRSKDGTVVWLARSMEEETV